MYFGLKRSNGICWFLHNVMVLANLTSGACQAKTMLFEPVKARIGTLKQTGKTHLDVKRANTWTSGCVAA